MSITVDTKHLGHQIYPTQCGGSVINLNRKLIFVDVPPKFKGQSGFGIGDSAPMKWRITNPLEFTLPSLEDWEEIKRNVEQVVERG
jgi:hypothetical protein